MDDSHVTTLTGTAVAIVAIARFVAASNPTLTSHLIASLAQAEAAGLKESDLELLRTVIKATTLLPAPERV